MTTVTENMIRCEMELKSPIDKVWSLVSSREGIESWFCGKLVGDVSPGEIVMLDFSEDEGCTQCFGRIETVDPTTHFAYSWHPGEDCTFDAYPEDQLTLVSFYLESVGDKTRLVVEETGFANIPAERRKSCLEMNTKGWEYELAELIKAVGA